MALSPLNPIEEIRKEVKASSKPYLTYRLNDQKGMIDGLIDGDEALRQFIKKALYTARSRYLIYDDQYGSEIEELIGAGVSKELLNEEIPRLIREALIYDDRIADVRDFSISHEGHRLHVEFKVIKMDGSTLEEEVDI